MHWTLVVTIFLFYGVTAAPVHEGSTNKTVCNSEQCLELALYLGNAINSSKNPCDNFYEFVCGNFIEETEIPPGEGIVNLLSVLGAKLDDELEDVILENIGVANTKATLLVTELYSTCLYSHGDIQVTLQFIKNIIPSFGGWPVLENGDWTGYSWQSVSYTSRLFGINANSFMPVSVDYDVYNTSKYSILLYSPFFLIPVSSLQEGLSNPDVQAYEKNIVNLVKQLGVEDLEYSKAEIKKILNFEIELARIAVSSETSFLTIEQLEAEYPNIPWVVYLTHMLGLYYFEFTKDDVIGIESISYIRGLNVLLQETDPVVLGSYLEFRAIENILNIGGVSFAKRLEGGHGKFGKFVKQKTLSLEYPEVCLSLIRSRLPHALASMYARKFMNSEIKNDISDMVTKIKETFLATVEENDWFDEQTKQNAMRKVVAMVAHSAYPDELFDDNILNEYYKNLQLDANYIAFQLNIQRFTYNNNFGKLTQPVNKTDWRSHSGITDMNAYYYPLENSLQILAGIIQNPMYRKGNPNYANYGSIGSVIGHEINHGFDQAGSQFNEYGEFFNWFTEESLEEYTKRVECLYELYLSVTKNASISQKTLNEDIADSGGMLVAYGSYQRWVANNQVEATLPGLDYTPNQLFWMFNSRVWCSKETQDYINMLYLFDVHSLGRYRGLVPMMNSPDFAKDFNCPVGSFMNPENKCKIW